MGADLVIEAVQDDLKVKQKLLSKVSRLTEQATPPIATNSLNLDVDEIFKDVEHKERCLGMRFLYPVYCIPEVEIRVGSETAMKTVEFCVGFLERSGKTAFFRSGINALILDDEQRDFRRQQRKRFLAVNRHLGGRERRSLLTPRLAHAGNFAPVQDDCTLKKESALDGECVICMDKHRGCVLSPCRHLCTCPDCGDMLVQRKDCCPICRRTIVDTVKFFRA